LRVILQFPAPRPALAGDEARKALPSKLEQKRESKPAEVGGKTPVSDTVVA
jgi:hypothetical protein